MIGLDVEAMVVSTAETGASDTGFEITGSGSTFAAVAVTISGSITTGAGAATTGAATAACSTGVATAFLTGAATGAGGTGATTLTAVRRGARCLGVSVTAGGSVLAIEIASFKFTQRTGTRCLATAFVGRARRQIGIKPSSGARNRKLLHRNKILLGPSPPIVKTDFCIAT
jgi:hypothetical protein